MSLGSPTYAAIVERIAAEHFVEPSVFAGRERTKAISEARAHLAAEFLALGLSTTEVGKLLGGRDHTTIVRLRDGHKKRVHDHPADKRWAPRSGK